MKVAAYQASLGTTNTISAILSLIRAQINVCESNGVEVLCCPEAVIGGLADYSDRISDFAVEAGEIETLLAPLASDRVTTIVGFTELGKTGLLYNSAAVFHKGSVIGIYRKMHPAIKKSVYSAGNEIPVFRINDLTFGIAICNDSNYEPLIRNIVDQGAAAIFIPTNNGLAANRFGPEIIAETKTVDIDRAVENGVYIIRADVAGTIDKLRSYGTSKIVGPNGRILEPASQLKPCLITAEIAVTTRSGTVGFA